MIVELGSILVSMGLAYLFALIVGLGILGLQAVMGGKGGGHDASADHGHSTAEHETGKGESESFDFVAFFLSFRFWIFTSLAFGMTGSLLHYLNLATPGIVFVLALVSGLAAGLFATWAFRFVARSSVSSTTDVTQARGTVGRVLVPVGKQKTGQIRVVLRGQSVDLVAKTEGEDIARGEQVIVEEIDGNTARVSKSPAELL